MPYINPTTTKIVTSANVTWSGGSLFSGYLLLGVALPLDSNGVQWAHVNLFGTSQPLPQWTVIPIIEGVLDNNTSVFPNSQIDPPNTKYAAYWYDNTWKLIYPFPAGTLPTLFTITGATYTITPPTLTSPTAATVAFTPVPQSEDATTSFTSTNIIEYVCTGTADGVNATFVIPYSPVVLAVMFIDGQKQDTSTYTRVGSVVTFNIAPTAGSSVTALVNTSIGSGGVSVIGSSLQVSTANGSITGTIDGVNRYFVIPSVSTISSIDWFWNGNYLTLGLDYTVAATTITMLGAVLPSGTDVLSARVWGS